MAARLHNTHSAMIGKRSYNVLPVQNSDLDCTKSGHRITFSLYFNGAVSKIRT